MVDVLSQLVSRAVNNDLVNGLKVEGEGISISHIQFANDIVFFSEANVDSLRSFLGSKLT